MIKVAFLDRDGTINKDYDDNKWKYINNDKIDVVNTDDWFDGIGNFNIEYINN